MTLSSGAVWSLTAPSNAAPTDPAKPVPSEPATVDNKTSDPAVARPDEPAFDPAQAHFRSGAAVMLEGRLGHTHLAADKVGETFLQFDVTADNTTGKVAAPLNVAIVIDHSGSMRGPRLDNALRAARGMVERMRDGDTVSVIGYSQTADIVVPATTLSPSTRLQVMSRIQSLPTRGHTCISCGIETGLQMLAQRNGAINRMLLLTDGQANRGVTDLGRLRELAIDAHNRGTSISSIGVDVEYNERLMQVLARGSNGRHHFVEQAQDLIRAFDTEFRSLVSTIARNTVLEIDLAPGIELAEVFGRNFQRSGNRVTIPVGTLTAGDRKTLIMRVQTSSQKVGTQAIANARMTYQDATRNTPGTCEGKLALARTADPGKLDELDPVIFGQLTRMETSKALQEANELLKAGEEEQARTRLQAQAAAVARNRADWKKRKRKKTLPAHQQIDDPFTGVDTPLESAQQGFSKQASKREKNAQIKRNMEFSDPLDGF